MCVASTNTANALQVCLRDGSAAMLVAKRSAGVAPEVNLKECISCTPLLNANKAFHSGFESERRHHQKLKTGKSVAPQKDLCPPKFFLKKTSCFYVSAQLESARMKQKQFLCSKSVSN